MRNKTNAIGTAQLSACYHSVLLLEDSICAEPHRVSQAANLSNLPDVRGKHVYSHTAAGTRAQRSIVTNYPILNWLVSCAHNRS